MALRKVLVEIKSGYQRLLNIDSKKTVSSDVLVLWDEDIDGVMPAITTANMGGYSRVANTLPVDTIKAQVQTDYDQSEVDNQTNVAASIAAMPGHYNAVTMNVEQAIRDIICALNLNR